MNAVYGKLIIKLLFWCIVELMLNALGMDSIADYGEFMTRRNHVCQVVLLLLPSKHLTV